MHNLFEQLRDCLNKQKIVAAKLLEASEQHLKALKKNNFEDIRNTVGKQEIIAGELAKMQRICAECQANIAKELGVQGIALSDLSAHAPSSLKDELKTIIQELRDLLANVQDTNEINKLLTQNALAFNQQLINIFLPNKSQTYKGDGAVDERQLGISRLNLTV